jgi:hypothetical protein
VNSNPDIVLDRLGRAVIVCARCASPLTHDDFFELGLRLPEPHETRDEYLDDELLDGVTHQGCSLSRQAG